MQIQNEYRVILVKEVVFQEAALKLTHLRIQAVLLYYLTPQLQLRIARRRGVPPPDGRLTIPLSAFPFLTKNGTRLRRYLEEMGLSFCFPLYSRTVQIHLQETMLQRLLHTEDGYCSVSLSTTLRIVNKHTLRLYWLICSWRNKGGFIISFDKLRQLLSLGVSYGRYDNLSGKVLAPAAAELKTFGEIWFLWRQRQGSLIFKIQVQPDLERRDADMKSAWDLCYRQLTAVGMSLKDIQGIFSRVDYADLNPCLTKLVDLTAHVRTARGIKDPARYVLKSLESWLSDWSGRYLEI